MQEVGHQKTRGSLQIHVYSIELRYKLFYILQQPVISFAVWLIRLTTLWKTEYAYWWPKTIQNYSATLVRTTVARKLSSSSMCEELVINVALASRCSECGVHYLIAKHLQRKEVVVVA